MKKNKIYGNFVNSAAMMQITSFKERLKELQKSYKDNLKEFKNIIDEMDTNYVNESELRYKSAELTILTANLDDLDQKIKNINESLKHLKEELEN